MSTICGKLGYEDSGVLLGDAAPTMVVLPFHAMGVVTGLEDVRIFFEDFIVSAHRSLQHDGLLQRSFCPTGVVQNIATIVDVMSTQSLICQSSTIMSLAYASSLG